MYQFLDKGTDFNSLGSDIERRKTYYKLFSNDSDSPGFMDDVKGFVDDYYNLSDTTDVSDDGILFGNITIGNPMNNSWIEPPVVYFRYL